MKEARNGSSPADKPLDDLEIHTWLENASSEERTRWFKSMVGKQSPVALPLLDGNKVNLSGADLSGMILRNADLGHVNLDGASLAGADLAGTRLAGASLNGADLHDAMLEEADLTNASLRFARMTKAVLEGAHLASADMWGANLACADLRNARLEQCSFREATLKQANLAEIDFNNVDLQQADLTGATLEGADLRKALVKHTIFNFANLRHTKLQDVDLTESQLAKIKLAGARLSQTLMDQSQLAGSLGDEKCGEFAQAARGYLALEQNFGALGDQDAARWAYRRRRRMQKKAVLQEAKDLWHARQQLPAAQKWLAFAMAQFVEWLCDYGESVSRILAALVVSYAVFAIIYGLTNSVYRLEHTLQGSRLVLTHQPLDLLLFSLSSEFPHEELKRTELGHFISSLQGMINVTLLGLLGFVIGERIKR